MANRGGMAGTEPLKGASCGRAGVEDGPGCGRAGVEDGPGCGRAGVEGGAICGEEGSGCGARDDCSASSCSKVAVGGWYTHGGRVAAVETGFGCGWGGVVPRVGGSSGPGGLGGEGCGGGGAMGAPWWLARGRSWR